MADKKNQHYIPKFYLRFFSYQNNKKQIGVFHTKNEKYIQKASLKHQACKPYYYGKDKTLEELFENLETNIAPVFSKIIFNNFYPSKFSEEYKLMLTLPILFILRTPTFEAQMNEQIRKMLELAEGNEDLIKEIKTPINPFKIGISSLLHLIQSAEDLDYKILTNNTSMPFVCSDSPTIRYNQYLEAKKVEGGINGFAIKGIQVFFPISPNKMLLIYDSDIYKIGSRKRIEISVDNLIEIKTLNMLQFINCDSSVYFNESISNGDVIELEEKCKKYRKPNLVKFKSFNKLNEFGQIDKSSEIIRSSSVGCRINLRLSFIKQTKKSKSQKIDPSSVIVRKKFEKSLPPLSEKIFVTEKR